MKTKPINKLIRLLNDPEEMWSSDLYTLDNDKRKLSIWVANGFLFYGLYVDDKIVPTFSLLEKLRLHPAIRRARRNTLEQLFSKLHLT